MEESPGCKSQPGYVARIAGIARGGVGSVRRDAESVILGQSFSCGYGCGEEVRVRAPIQGFSQGNANRS